MSQEIYEEGKGRHELSTLTPKYIQRCEVSEESISYDYMGSSEFEVGDQAKSLKRIFASGIYEYTVAVTHNDENIVFGLVAGKDFAAEKYAEVIKGIIDRSFFIKEATYIDKALDRTFNPRANKDRNSYFPATNAWFDFTNDVFFTFDPQVAVNIKTGIEKIKVKWETPEPEHIQKFKAETKVIEESLREKGIWVFFLGNYADIDGTPHAWLNSGEDFGWFTHEELKAWSGKGKVERIKKQESDS